MALGHWAKNYLGGGNSNSGGGSGGGAMFVNLARADEPNFVADKTNAEIVSAAENGPVLFRLPANLMVADAEGEMYFPFQGYNIINGVYHLYAGEAAGVKCEGAVSGQSGLADSYPLFYLSEDSTVG